MDHQQTPPLLIDEDQLLGNLEQIWAVTQRTKTRILLDQTAFPTWPLYPMLGFYLSGTTAATAAQAETGLRQMDRDSHGFLSTTAPEEFSDMLPLCHHMTFATLEQWQQLSGKAQATGLTCALTIQPTEQCCIGVPLNALPHPPIYSFPFPEGYPPVYVKKGTQLRPFSHF